MDPTGKEFADQQFKIIQEFLNGQHDCQWRMGGWAGMGLGQAIVGYATQLEDLLAKERRDFVEVVQQRDALLVRVSRLRQSD